jgi:beta-lactamase regulating signal transducer with metallopeptidase domain
MSLSYIFREILNLSLMGMLLTILLILIKKLLRNRLSASWHYMIWFLLVFRLIIPIAPANSMSIYNLFMPVMMEVQQQGSESEEIPHYTEKVEESSYHDNVKYEIDGIKNENESIKDNDAKRRSTLFETLSLIWFIGAGIIAVITIIRNIVFYKKIKYGIQCSDPNALMVMEECCKTLLMKKTVPIYLNKKIRGPLLFGLIKPRIIISGELLNNISRNEIKHVFLHELIHYKRLDIFTNFITAVLRCIYWFNPILHYGFYKMEEDRELSCDEMVLKKLSPCEYKSYGLTIINLAKLMTIPYSPTCTSTLIQKKTNIQRRISMISKFKQKTALTTAFTVLLTILIGCSTLTNAKPVYQTSAGNPEPPPKQNVTLLPPEENTAEKTSGTSNIDFHAKDEDVLPEDSTIEEKVEFYLEKLKDKDYIGTYNEGYIWYTAAEELGKIGKPAIPGLIQKLETQDDYERALALYALLLATQHDNVKSFTDGEYIIVNLDFNKENHPEMVDIAIAWWNKYKDNF